MRKRTLAIWTATVGLLAATSVKTAQAAPCPTTGNITSDCDAPGVSVVIDDQSSGGGVIVDCSLGPCALSAPQATEKFYSLHDRAAYDFIIVAPNFNAAEGARYIPIDSGDGVIRPDTTEHDVTGLSSPSTSVHMRAGYGATGHLQGYIQLPNFLTLPADPNARLPAADPNGHHSSLSLLSELMGHRFGAYSSIPAGGLILTSGGKNWQYYTNSASTCPSAAPAGSICASALWGNNWPATGALTTNSRTDGFSQLDQYFMGLRGAPAVDPFFYVASPTGGPASTAAPHRAGNPAVTLSGGTRTNVTINDIVTQNGARSPSAAESPKSFGQAFVLLSQNGNPVTQTSLTQLQNFRRDWVRYFTETTDHLGEVDTRVKQRPIDVVLLLDLSGSFFDDLPVLQAQIGPLLDDLAATTSPNTRFGIASFVDFPFAPHGSTGDYTYKVDLPLTTNRALVASTVNGLTTYDGANLPQNQYEALYQLITGEGLNLNPPILPNGMPNPNPSDNDYTDPGEVAPSSIGHTDINVPLFILLFTDATFHNPDTELTYPSADANQFVHGRATVLSHLIPPSPFTTAALAPQTPKNFVFGLVPGLGLPPPGILEIPELSELAAATGGNVFPIASDSAGFTPAIKQAVEQTEVPILTRPHVLKSVKVRQASVHWNHDHDDGDCDDDDKKPSKKEPSLSLVLGQVDLPNTTNFAAVGPHAKTALTAGNLSLVTDEVNLTASTNRFGTLWHFADHSKQFGITGLDILWTSPTHGEYLLQAQFDSQSRGLDGKLRPATLTTLLGLGTGADMLSGDTTVQPTQWKTLTAKHWRSRLLIPLTASASAVSSASASAEGTQTSEEEQFLAAIARDSEASQEQGSIGCAITTRRSGADGKTGALAAMALFVASAVVRRRKRS